MDTWQMLMHGFSIALHPTNLLYCFAGTFIGTLIGVLPGIGPTATLSLLLPFTYNINAISALIMLSGIFMGANYGGSTTSILVNIPGESSSIATCFDGYMMAKKGRAGPALGIAAFGSFIAGTIAIFGLIFFTPILTDVALKFGPSEYGSLMILSLTLLSCLARGSKRKAFMMAALGLILGCVGSDYSTGKTRFVYGLPFLLEGIDLVPLIMGLFGVAEILSNLEIVWKTEIYAKKIKGLFPNGEDWKASIGAILRGTGIGFVLGLIPGTGGVIPTFVDYAVEKKISRHPEAFGTGVIEGVAGPESTNNAHCQASFIPMFSLGIPSSAVIAVLMGALMIHGLQPSPMMIKNSPDLFWGVVSSMYIANGMLLILNLPLIALWVQILRVPYPILSPLILLFCMIGAYSIRNSVGDMVIMSIFGIAGYLMRKLKYEPAPFIMAFILGESLEISVRQSLDLFHGDPIVFLQRPISLGLLIAAALIIIAPALLKGRDTKIPDG
jgi:putative tricarboxylic transport membrane protein